MTEPHPSAYASILHDPPRLRLRIRVQPRAARSRIAGVHGDAVKVQVAAPAVEGAANAALIAFLAETFGTRRTDIAVVSGAHSRSKVVDIATETPEGVRRRLEILLGSAHRPVL